MQPSHPPARATAQRSTSRSGHQTKAGCRWSLNFSRHADGMYTLTGTRCLEHNGHDCIVPGVLEGHVDSLCVVPEDVVAHVRDALESGVHGMEQLRRLVEKRHQLAVN